MSQARIWMEHCARNEWGNETMQDIAKRRFEEDASIDIVEVWEHGGWHLSWNRDLIVVGTANDMAQFSRKAIDWCKQFTGSAIVGETRRDDMIDQRYPNYFPCISAAVA